VRQVPGQNAIKPGMTPDKVIPKGNDRLIANPPIPQLTWVYAAG
jgi:hypothetical protein